MIEQQEHRFERRFVPKRVEGIIHVLREEKKQAERANHDKSRFLAVASHDLRQPIHALGLYIAELRRKIFGEEQKLLLGQVERSVDAITTLVDSLLDISKLDAGVVVPKKQACNVFKMLARIGADFKMLAKVKNIRLIVHAYPVYVFSDPVLLERILTNLLSNALRYTPLNGTVLMACRRREGDLIIEVRDNGIGIDQVHQVNIFGEYFQLKQIQQNAQLGLGLGLSIVDRLVKLLGHGIALRSAPNKGSTFSLRLALVSKPVCLIAGKVVADHGYSTLSEIKLLIVSANGMISEGTARLFSTWGCKVSVIHTFPALQRQLIDGEDWDLLICDVEINENLRGQAVVQLVRQHLKRPVPCILISNDSQPDMPEVASEAGYSLLYTPIKLAKLRSLMNFLLLESINED
ncbi:MAG: HAMP domain-containing sensor histidine kinase [Gallionella sp.]